MNVLKCYHSRRNSPCSWFVSFLLFFLGLFSEGFRFRSQAPGLVLPSETHPFGCRDASLPPSTSASIVTGPAFLLSPDFIGVTRQFFPLDQVPLVSTLDFPHAHRLLGKPYCTIKINAAFAASRGLISHSPSNSVRSQLNQNPPSF